LEFLGLPEFAVQFHQTIVDALPGDVTARERLCGAFAASYRWTAMAHHRRVLTVLEGDELADGDRAERAEAYYEAGIALRRRGAALRAIAALDRAAEYAPGRLEPIADGALARIDAGEYAAARRCLEQALAIAGAAERETLEALLALVRDRYDRPSPR
jgi:tetratricopeptide (TPR) repeat protein